MGYFEYGEKEISYLKSKDKKLGEIIDAIGDVKRELIPNLYQSLVRSIVAQQISNKAYQTVWQRMLDKYGDFTPDIIDEASLEEIQSLGMSMRKATYIKSLSAKIVHNTFDIDILYELSDEEVCNRLSTLDGIGVWTAEMIMIHSMQRKDILSYGDLAILRGLRMVYHHRKIDKKLFNKYKRRFSPYGTIASIYLWEVSTGRLPELKDYAVKVKR